MLNKSGESVEKFTLDAGARVLVRLTKQGPGPYSYSFNTKATFLK